MSALTDWLASLGLDRYAERFQRERIDLDVLPELTESDLEKLGVALGDRKRLLRAASALSAPVESQPPTPAATPTVELRQVTILFVDLSGYTQLTATLGAEITHKLVQRFYAMVNDLVRSHSGSIERHIGDAVMAVFGLPVAHGNDPERALRAAQAIHEAMPVLGAQFGRPLFVHAGIASGQVVASRAPEGEDFATVGDAVNLAARLVNLAPAGGTVLSDAVHRAIGARVSAEPIENVTVKGFERPVRAWRVREWRARGSDRAAIVGRDDELARFGDLIDRAQRDRRGGLVVVRGEAGIGKTRLLEEFAAIAVRADFACHSALVLDFGAGRALDPIGRLVASIAGASGALDEESRKEALHAAQAEGLVLEEEAMSAADLLSLPLPESSRPTYEAMDSAARQRLRTELVVQLVRRASNRAPQLLVVEDLHWAAPQTLQDLAAIVAGIRDRGVVIVLSSRLQGDPTAALCESWNAPQPPLTFDLQPLPQAQARALARSLAGVDEAALEPLVQRAGGNPLYLEQLLRNAASVDAEALPGSIQSLVLARLDRLSGRDRQALQAASVLGQVFSLAQLRHLLADRDYRCDVLVEERLVRDMGEEYLFAHALVWEGTYLSLLTEQKRAWHIAAADWFGQHDPTLTAEHLDRAQDERAAQAYLSAARAELRVHRPDRAVKALERGVAIAGDPVHRVGLLADLARLLPAVGRAQDALEAARRLHELAADGAQRARACIEMANALRLLDRSREALDTLEEAEREAPDALDHADRARIHYLRGSLFFPLAQANAGLSEHTRALEHARLAGSIELQLRALSGMGDAHYASNRLVSAYNCFHECVELSRAHSNTQIEAANLPMLAICAQFVGRIDDGLPQAQAAHALARRIANPRSELIANHALCMILLDFDEVDRALEHAQASVDIARSVGARRFVPEGLMFVGQCLARRGMREAARGHLLEALDLAREHISYFGPCILGTLAVHADNGAEREAWLREGESVLQDGTPAHNHIGFYSAAIEASLQAHSWDEALRYCDLLEACFREEPAPLPDFTVASGRVRAQLGNGRRDPALRASLLDLIERGTQAKLRVSVAALQQTGRQAGWLT
jgi:class 3 adenylate cyclase/tetratricopeptide (TPR) repeat protein